jgi:NAD(P)-dependent dehydrogenase (short-subunit alcohol dehydrogenase family)
VTVEATTRPFSDALAGRVVLVTGGGGGIGSGLARGLAAHGATIIITGRTAASLASTADKIRSEGGHAHAYALDVTDAAACAVLAERVSSEVGDVSLLVNNAGVIEYASIDDPEIDAVWHRIIDTNLSGPFNVARGFLRHLKDTRGAIVNIGSIAGLVSTSNTVGYSASKGGVHMLTVALAKELGQYGIRVNTIAPGAINTGMSPSASDESRRAALIRRVPLARIGEPEDLVGPVVFLASSMSAYVTGATLLVDGGYLTS